MFARKLKALGYHSPNSFSINGKIIDTYIMYDIGKSRINPIVESSLKWHVYTREKSGIPFNIFSPLLTTYERLKYSTFLSVSKFVTISQVL